MGQITQETPRTGQVTGLGGRLLNLIEALVFLAVAAQIIAFFGRFHFLPDLATHFRVQSVVSLLLGGIIC